MLVALFNAVKVESISLKSSFSVIAGAVSSATRRLASIRTLGVSVSQSATVLAVAGNWGSELTELIPLSLVIALSPLTIIPTVLVLRTPRARPAGLAFTAGWLISLAGLTAVFVAFSSLLGGLHKAPPAWASWLRIVAGSALIGFGIYRWLTRHSHTEMPAWMRSFTDMTPRRAAVAAIAMAVARPEVLFTCAAAGLAVGSAGLGRTGAWLAAAVFVAVAASSVAVPALAYASAGDHLDEPLTRLKDGMERHHAASTAAVLAIIGVMVTYHGIDAL